MNRISRKLPGMAMWIIGRLFEEERAENIIGDFEETYLAIADHDGSGAAGKWLAGELLKVTWGRLRNNFYWGAAMFTNYMKITKRSMMKQKIYSFINIAGLAMGMTCCIFIFLYVNQELSYDRYHPGNDRIFRVYEEIVNKTSTRKYAPIAAPVAPVIMEKHPNEVEYAARVLTWYETSLIAYGDRMFFEDRFLFADEDIFNILSVQFIQGEPASALARPGTVVLTRKMADKYFRGENPIGKTLKVDELELEVTGVIEDSPENTHLKYNFFASNKTLDRNDRLERWFQNWYGTMTITYLKLRPNADVDQFASSIEFIADEYIGESLRSWEETRRFLLQPVADIHLHSNFVHEIEPPGSVTNIILLSAIGMLVLVIASLNFINLSTARSATRAREVGLRKVIGGKHGQLIFQFLCESTVISVMAVALSVMMLRLLMPFFNGLAGTGFSMNDITDRDILAGLLLVTVLNGAGAGLYPAFFLSSFSPSSTLRGKFSHGNKGRNLRTGLVILQFAISIMLIIGTLIIRQQIYFMKDQDLGFDKEQKLCIPVRGNASLSANGDAVKAAFLGHPSVKGLATSSSVPGRELFNFAIQVLGQDEDFNQGMLHLYCGPEFLELFEIEMIAGRSFREDMPTDLRTRENGGAFIINEAAAAALGFDPPGSSIGAVLKSGNSGSTGPVIGVTRDFHFRGLQSTIEPVIMQWDKRIETVITLDIETSNLGATLAELESVWKGFFSDSPFERVFLDEDFNRLYVSEERIGGITGIFTLIGTIIASLGLLGLTSYAVEQRRKEIGVRKVLGASVIGINMMLIKDFTKWVLLANIIAWPFAWYVMDRWLDGFATRTGIDPWIFVLSGAIALGAAILTVSFQSTRAAVTDPVKCLRYE